MPVWKDDSTASEGWVHLFISDKCSWSLKFVGSMPLDLMNDEVKISEPLLYSSGNSHLVVVYNLFF